MSLSSTYLRAKTGSFEQFNLKKKEFINNGKIQITKNKRLNPNGTLTILPIKKG